LGRKDAAWRTRGASVDYTSLVSRTQTEEGKTMLIPLRSAVFTLTLSCLAAGCASLGANSEGPRATAPESEPAAEKPLNLSQQRLLLSEGYSILYDDASNLDLVGLILYAKAESDAVDDLVTSLGDFGGKLKLDLERIARDYPGVRIDLDPLPEMEKRKRLAIATGRVKYFAPLIGRSGREYERTVLLSFSNGVNHERHLCQVMAEEEPDAGLKKFLLDTEKGYSALYDRIQALLESEYFKDPDGPTK
jgi:hypothetical protein